MSGNNSSGWNRPASNQPSVKKGGAKAPSAMKGVIVGAVAVLIGVVCLWLFSGGEDAPKAKPEKDRGRIEEVTPAPAPKAKPVATSEPAAPKPIRWAKYVQNAALDDEGRPQFVPRPGHQLVTNNVHGAKQPYEIFEHNYQNELASYMTAPPGTMFVGEMRYDERFVKEVVETMSLPIKDDENDTPEQKELRQSMREVMKSLQAQVDAGRDVAEIFSAAREEMRELGLYKMQLRQEVFKIYKDSNMSDEEMDDTIKAANMMLEQKGIAPLDLQPFTKDVLKHAKDMRPESERIEEEEVK